MVAGKWTGVCQSNKKCWGDEPEDNTDEHSFRTMSDSIVAGSADECDSYLKAEFMMESSGCNIMEV